MMHVSDPCAATFRGGLALMSSGTLASSCGFVNQDTSV